MIESGPVFLFVWKEFCHTCTTDGENGIWRWMSSDKRTMEVKSSSKLLSFLSELHFRYGI